MVWWKWALIVFAVVVFVRILTSVSGYLRGKYYKIKYEDYLNGKNVNITEYQRAISKLASGVHVHDSTVMYTQTTSVGDVVMTGQGSLTNLRVKDPMVIDKATAILDATIGAYRAMILESISPLFWIRQVVFLPRSLAIYFGGDGNGVFTKILQLLWWILTPMAVAFRTQIYDWITVLFQ